MVEVFGGILRVLRTTYARDSAKPRRVKNSESATPGDSLQSLHSLCMMFTSSIRFEHKKSDSIRTLRTPEKGMEIAQIAHLKKREQRLPHIYARAVEGGGVIRHFRTIHARAAAPK